jgi:hypothetical protein
MVILNLIQQCIPDPGYKNKLLPSKY